jgi:hypothetical protein
VEEEMGGVAEVEIGCGRAAEVEMGCRRATEVEWAAAAEEKEEMEMPPCG